jgi:TonB family protein
MIMYIIQVSIALILFYGGYALCLKQQTNFALLRSYLLFSLLASVVTPLINFRTLVSVFWNVTPQPAFESTWLPEVTVTAIQTTTRTNLDWVMMLNTIYIAGAIVSALYLFISIFKLKRLLAQAKPKQDRHGWYYQLSDMQQSFSFFRYVFLASGSNHSEEEQKTILAHERAHVRLGHSFDVIFVRLVAILVWFNPAVYWFKRKLEEVHEFQADASTIKSAGSEEYCVLLVRETLESNHISLANHFNKSLTLKRIQMIQSIKKNVSRARLIGLGVLVLLVFAIFSCEEKVLADLKNAAKQSVLVTEYPDAVRQAVNQIKASTPASEIRVYGLVKTSDISEFMEGDIQTVTYVSVADDADFSGYAILSDKQVKQAAGHLIEKRGNDQVFTIVEDMAQPVNGMTDFYKFIGRNIKYPIQARTANVEGRVFVNFLVDQNGKLSDFKIIRGIGSGCDEEAVRVLSMSPNWKPGMQGGVGVKSIFNMAVVFKLDQNEVQTDQQKVSKVVPDQVIELQGKLLPEIVVSGQKPKGN